MCFEDASKVSISMSAEDTWLRNLACGCRDRHACEFMEQEVVIGDDSARWVNTFWAEPDAIRRAWRGPSRAPQGY